MINQKGFSLIEAMIAMLILTVGLLALGVLQIGGMKSNANALNRTDGGTFAQTVLDTLRALPVDDDLLTDTVLPGTLNGLDQGIAVGGNAPIPANADHTGAELFDANPTPGLNGQTYTVFWNVSDDIPVPGAKTVRVFVYWTDQRFGQNRAIATTVMGGLYL